LVKCPALDAIYLSLVEAAINLRVTVLSGDPPSTGSTFALDHSAGKFKGRPQLVAGLHRELAEVSPSVAGPSPNARAESGEASRGSSLRVHSVVLFGLSLCRVVNLFVVSGAAALNSAVLLCPLR
jgi:hypothetical protein